MLELGLLFCLLGSMGVYIFKSADLPSELKERSERLEAENSQVRANKKLHISLEPLESRKSKKLNNVENKIEIKIAELASNENAEIENDKINQLIQEKKLIETKIELTKKEIAQLNYEIRINIEKNTEIQKKISIKEITLKSLEEKLNKLA